MLARAIAAFHPCFSLRNCTLARPEPEPLLSVAESSLNKSLINRNKRKGHCVSDQWKSGVRVLFIRTSTYISLAAAFLLMSVLLLCALCLCNLMAPVSIASRRPRTVTPVPGSHQGHFYSC